MVKLEDLQVNNFHIYQDKDSFNFGIDAVLLANFALKNISLNNDNTNYKIDYDYKICDLCSGSLPIPLIMYAKKDRFFAKKLKIDAFEIDKKQFELSNESINWNATHITKNILYDVNVFNDDIKNILSDKTKYNKFYDTYDAITCNPPYIKFGSGIVNKNDNKNVARHEIKIDFDSICKIAKILLKSNKKFYLIHHTERFSEIVSTLNKNSFQIKKVSFVYPDPHKISNLVLIEAVKNGNCGVKVLKPLIIYNDNNEYTEDILKFYE